MLARQVEPAADIRPLVERTVKVDDCDRRIRQRLEPGSIGEQEREAGRVLAARGQEVCQGSTPASTRIR